MAKEAIKRISEAEFAAAETEKNVAAECKRIIEDAENKAAEFIESARRCADDIMSIKTHEAKKAAEEINKRAETEASKESLKIRIRASQLKERAVSIIIDELIRR